MTKSKFFLLLSCIFLGANLFSVLFWQQPLAFPTVALILLLVFLLALKWRWCLVFFVIFLAITRVNFFILAHSQPANFVYEQNYEFTAQVVDLDQRLNGWQLVLRPDNLDNFKGKILVYAPLYPEYQLGDKLNIQAKLFRPEAFVSELTGRNFAYDKYLAKDNILAVAPLPNISIIPNPRPWYYAVGNSKQYFLNNLNTALPEPAAAFTKAIILDSRRELPAEINPSFSYTGLTHVISISGLHMVVIIWFWQSFLQWLGVKRQYIFWVLVLTLGLYLYLLGFISPALRSTAMILLVLLGPMIGRPAISAYSLLFLADVLVLLNPYILVYDLGFQLSFSATLGLILYTAWWQQQLKFVTNFLKIREVLAVTLGAQMFTWPLVLYYFGTLSLVAPLANFLVLPLFPPILILALLTAIFGGVIAQVLSYPLLLLVKLMFYLVEHLGSLPYAYWQEPNFFLAFFLVSLVLMVMITIIIKPYAKQTD